MSSLVALFLVSLLAFGPTASAAPSPELQPRAIPGQWIVALKPESAPDLAVHTRWVSEVHARSIQRRGNTAAGLERTYEFDGFVGYAGAFDEETLDSERPGSPAEQVITLQRDDPRGVFLVAITTDDHRQGAEVLEVVEGSGMQSLRKPECQHAA